MISSTLKVAGGLFAVCLIVNAQNQAPKMHSGGSSVSGRITLKGDGVPGVLVGARPMNSSRQTTGAVTKTDEQGNYRLANLTAGQYDILTNAPQFVVPGPDPIKRLIIGEGETIENVDFTLVRGGVITGKVVDGDGRPIIEESVEVYGTDGVSNDAYSRFGLMATGTDDRGIYRIYGLPPGKYRVAAGTRGDMMQYGRGRGSGVFYTQTFYQAANDSPKGTLVDVGEGSEVTNIDITLRRAQAGFTVTAKVVDADTGKPIANARCGLEKFRENGSFAQTGLPSNGLGELKLENLTPGKYALFLDAEAPSEMYAEPVRFEVVDQDVKDLVIKALSASSISGVIVFEGVDEKVARTRMAEIVLYTHSISPETERMNGGSPPPINVGSDGSFRVGGLRPGTVHFGVWGQRKNNVDEYEVARIERDGVAGPSLQLKAREQINGLRLIVRLRSGRIRGVLKFENGEFPTSRIFMSAKRVGEEYFEASLQLDNRGHFLSEPLAAGVYELRVMASPNRGPAILTKQQVVVAENQTSEVTLTLDLKPAPDQKQP